MAHDTLELGSLDLCHQMTPWISILSGLHVQTISVLPLFNVRIYSTLNIQCYKRIFTRFLGIVNKSAVVLTLLSLQLFDGILRWISLKIHVLAISLTWFGEKSPHKSYFGVHS